MVYMYYLFEIFNDFLICLKLFLIVINDLLLWFEYVLYKCFIWLFFWYGRYEIIGINCEMFSVFFVVL